MDIPKNEYYTQLDNLMPLFLERMAAGQKVRFAPRGISMLPMLRQGIDTVTLSPPPERLKKYDLPLYRRDDGKYILHRIVRVGEAYTCMGDNQFLPEPGIRQDQILALVTGFSRGDREHSVEEPAYRLYCRFWHYSRFPRRCLRWLKRRLSL